MRHYPFSYTKRKEKSLDAWRERVGYQAADPAQAARRGTEMHCVLEQYLNGVGYLNLSKDGSLPRMMAHTIVDNLDQFSRVYGTRLVTMRISGQDRVML